MIRTTVILGALALAGVTAPASAQQTPEAANMRLVGYSDLQARSAYQPLVHQQSGRWIAYIGHHGGIPEAEKPTNPLTGQPEFNGTSLVDVTDPAIPKYLAHIPGERGNYEAGGAQMVRVCDGKTLPKGDPKAVYLLRPFGNQAHEIWNTADPATRFSSLAPLRGSRARTRVGGNATRASPTSFPASRAGGCRG